MRIAAAGATGGSRDGPSATRLGADACGQFDAGFHLARELARPAESRPRARLFLFLTSLHAGTPRKLPHYSTAKAALAMLVKELAGRWGRYGIRVNALVPGAIAAGGFVADPSLAKHIPLGAPVKPRTSHRWHSPCCRTRCRLRHRGGDRGRRRTCH